MPEANDASPAPNRAATLPVGTRPRRPNRQPEASAAKRAGDQQHGHAPDADEDLDDQTDTAGSERSGPGPSQPPTNAVC